MSAILTNEIARPRAERGPHTIAFRIFDVDGEPCTQGHDVCVAGSAMKLPRNLQCELKALIARGM